MALYIWCFYENCDMQNVGFGETLCETTGPFWVHLIKELLGPILSPFKAFFELFQVFFDRSQLGIVFFCRCK